MSPLLLPLIAMQFTSEVRWDLADFWMASMLLFTLGATIEVARRLSRRPLVRAGMIGPVVAVVALVWAEAAVGVF